jgi:hypothetical protein
MTISVSALAERALRRLNVRIVPLDDSPTMTEMVPAATIATGALIELGVIAADETPAPADQALLVDKVASVHAAIDALGTVWWTGDAVPRAFAEEYTKLAAAYAASSFGKTVDPAVVLMLEGRVRKGAAVIASHDIAVEAVLAVHTHLVARGMARWSSQDIPDLAAMPYEMLAAAEMAPKFGQEVNAAEMLLAMRQLAIVTALPTSGERVMAEYF